MTTELQVGDRIKDNDPRMGGRVLTVIELLSTRVLARSSLGRVVRILRQHIYTDGKARKTGFSRLPSQ